MTATTTGGLFVVFDGGEGAGKTTQLDRLAYLLLEAGKTVTVTREPGHDTALGTAIRRLLLEGTPGDIPARAEALLFAACRADHIHHVIVPALERGDIVLCDRYADSSIAYQGFGRRLGPGQVGWISDWATENLVPDLVVLLDVDPQTGLARAKRTGPADRFEQEELEFHRLVRQGFLTRAHSCPDRYLKLDAADSPDVLAAVIAARVMTLIEERARRRPEPAKVIYMSDRSPRCERQT